jgi:ABC-type amino acid transport substrate-binding protein
MTPLRLALAATAFCALAMPAAAQNQPSGMFESALGQPRAISDFPKPWPLKNLVTPGKLTVGTTGTSPPRTYVDPATGKLTGSYVKLFEKIAADLGLEIELVKLDWPGILPGLAANRFDLACDGASWSAARLGSSDFLMTSPTAVNATVGLTRKNSGVTTWESAANKKIGGVRGEIYFENAKAKLPTATALELAGLPETLIALANRQIDLAAINLSNALVALEKAPNKDDLVLVGPPLQVFAQSLCINPREPDLLVAVNTLLGNYRADGTLKAIIAASGASTAEVELLGKIGY